MTDKNEIEVTPERPASGGSLGRWDPFRELGVSRIGGLMEELLREYPRQLAAPAVDVTETDDAYQISAEVPGVKKDDIRLEIEKGVLTLQGEKRSEREEKSERARHLERTYGAFRRSFTLPADADPEQVKAKFEDGVLRVTIAKSPEAKPKAIVIQS